MTNKRKIYNEEIFVNYLYNTVEYKDHVDPIYKTSSYTLSFIQKVYIFMMMVYDKKIIHMTTLDVDKDNIDEYYHIMCNCVDFDICKNIYYDGKLIIKNIEDILNKKITFQCNTLLEESIKRYPKYTARGFTFENDQLKYEDLKDADHCTQQVFTDDLSTVPISYLISLLSN